MSTDFIERLRKIDAVVAKYDDITGTMADTVRSESGVLSAEKMQEELANIARENRLLSIGIIGRVKAGKSSLLNALFFDGKELLPKAATPMTAALTVIRYGEQPSAEVEFFSKTDIAAVKKNHDDFVARRKKLFDEKLAEAREKEKKRNIPVDMAKIERSVDRDMQNDAKKDSWEQYNFMGKSGLLSEQSLNESKTIAASSIDDLMGKLDEYVSSGGRYMPFTKDVILNLPIDKLHDIQIVDTPGVNDPVKSREKRTEDYLGQCDVVFVVSPAGEFISQEDLNLMGHVSGKKGVQEVFLVASRSDQQLYGSIKEESRGSLPDGISMIKNQLSSQARDVFTEKRKENPESAEMYDSLISNMENRVVITSAICHALLRQLNDRNSWDEDMTFAWQRLTEEYPDFFSDSAAEANLALLSGVDKVQGNVSYARENKDNIKAQKQDEYAAKQKQNVEGFLSGIRSAVQEGAARLQETDAAQLKIKKATKERLLATASVDVDDAFDESVFRFKSDLSATLKQNSRGLFDDVGDFSQYEKSETKTKEVSHTRVKGTGFLNWLSRGRWGNETYYTTEQYTVRTLQTAPIKRKLNDVVQALQEDLADNAEKAVMEWRGIVQSKTISALRSSLGDDDIDIPLLKTSIRKVVGNMQIPPFSLSSAKFSTEYSGILKDDGIDSFLEEANEYVGNLRSAYSSQIRNFLNDMETSAKKEKLSSLLFGSMDAELSELEKQIANKESTLQRYNACLAELSDL